MTTRNDVKATLLKYFTEEWGTRTTVAYDNVEFTPPDNSSWVRVSVVNNNSLQYSLGEEGSRKFERYGLILFQVFTPLNVGTYEGDVLCEDIINIFESKRFGTIHTYSGTYGEVGSDDKWFQFNGSLQWDVQITK